MKKGYIKGKNGYDIPYEAVLNGDEEKVIIVSHGFASSYMSPTAQMILNGMPEHGFGVVAYDFPGHGQSQSGPKGLRVENCMRDLAAVEEWTIQSAKAGAEIMYFSSSFGGYINLRYLTDFEHQGTKSFLRSCAVNMPELFEDLGDEVRESLKRTGQVALAYDPPMVITAEFLADMAAGNLFELYHPGFTKTEMVHGEMDETIDPQKAKAFAEKFDIDITMVPSAGHRLMDEGQPEQVFELALRFFNR